MTERYIGSQNERDSGKVLGTDSAIRSSFTITQLQETLRRYGIDAQQFYADIRGECLSDIDERGGEGSDVMPFSRAVLLSQFSYQDLEQVAQFPYEENALHVDLFAKPWRNCTEAEDFFRKSLAEDSVLAVNAGRLVVKPRGYITALCVESFSTEAGTFIEGVWYSPVSSDAREKIKDAITDQKSVISLTEGSWLPVRGAYTADRLIEDARATVGLESRS
jgi:hypothetical protein